MGTEETKMPKTLFAAFLLVFAVSLPAHATEYTYHGVYVVDPGHMAEVEGMVRASDPKSALKMALESMQQLQAWAQKNARNGVTETPAGKLLTYPIENLSPNVEHPTDGHRDVVRAIPIMLDALAALAACSAPPLAIWSEYAIGPYIPAMQPPPPPARTITIELASK
jgi:hypothetical protein